MIKEGSVLNKVDNVKPRNTSLFIFETVEEPVVVAMSVDVVLHEEVVLFGL